MPTLKYMNDAFKFWTSIFSLISGTKMKFSINFAAMLNYVRQIESSLNRKPSLELFDITHAQYTYTYLLTGRISKLGLHSLKSYTCVRFTSWITLVAYLTLFPLFMTILICSLSFAYVLCWGYIANNMDPDQTALLGAV